MDILLDTNIYLADVTFGKPEHEALKNYLRTAHGSIIMPDIVQREVAKNIKAKAVAEATRISTLYSVSLGLISAPPHVDQIEEAISSKFTTGLQCNRVVNVNNEETSLEQIIERSLAETPPFKSKGRGFRDALIWYSLLDYLSTNPSHAAAFITDNSADFGVGTLKPELIEELTRLGFQERVVYFQSLNDFLAQYGEPLTFIDDDFVYEAINDYVESYAEDIDESDLDIDYPRSDVDWYVNSVDYEEFEVDNYYIYRTTTGHYYLNVEYTMNFYVGIEGEHWDWDWDYMRNEFGHVTRRVDDHVSCFVTREIELKIDKNTHDVELL